MSHDTHHHGHSDFVVLTGTIDPVCQMTVDPDHAAGSSTYKGSTYFFCSTHCQQKFDAHSEQFVKDTKAFVDPVCGMTVDPKQSGGAYTYNGEEFHFCCPKCLAKFK